MTAKTPARKGQQPESLAEFAKSSRREHSDSQNKSLTADSESKPIPADNEVAHDVAETILNEGAKGEKPDAKRAGVDELPDRVVDNKRR